jgi:hypothetical protein
MMSIDEADKIDLMFTDKEKTRVDLVISDHLDWEEDEGEHLLLLQDKINSYLHFIESGQLTQERPDLAGLPVLIRVSGKYLPSEEATKFYRLAGRIVAEAGSALELVLPTSGTKMQF